MRAVESGRHAASAFFGRFIFFSRLGLFWRFGITRVLPEHDETGLPPDPKRTRNRQNFMAIFFGEFKKASQERGGEWLPLKNTHGTPVPYRPTCKSRSPQSNELRGVGDTRRPDFRYPAAGLGRRGTGQFERAEASFFPLIKIAKKKLAIKIWRFSVLGMGVSG